MADEKAPGKDTAEDLDPSEGRLSRWSRLKQAERTGDEVPDPELRQETSADLAPIADGEESGEVEEIDPADLPDIETMDKDSDFSVFMQKGVPEMLQRKALSKLWRLDPAFGFLDGMNDYDEDYSMIGMVAMEIKTAYQAGKGFVDPEEEKAKEEAEKEAAAKAEAESEDAGAEGEDAEEKDAATSETESGEVEEESQSASSVRRPGENDPPPDPEGKGDKAAELDDDEIGDGEDEV